MSALPSGAGSLGPRHQLSLAAFLVSALITLLPAAGADAATARVSIDAPRSGAILSGEAVVFASTRGRATKVVFYVDGAKRQTERDRPYNYRLDTRVLANGPHEIEVRATFPSGRKARVTKTVTVDNGPAKTVDVDAAAALPALLPPAPVPPLGDHTAPTVSFRTPVNGTTVAESLGQGTCEAPARDDVGIARVEFTVDGKALNVEKRAPYNCRLDTAELANGSHTLGAIAYDAAGNASQRAVATVNVQNESTGSDPAPTPAPAPTSPPNEDPTTTPVPTAPPAATGREVFTGDFETGDFSQWNAVQSEVGGTSKIVSTARQGRYAAAFTVPAGGKRAEVYASGPAYVGEGDERIYRWSTMPAAGYQPSATSNYEVILQWKNEGTGSPPMAFEIEGPNYAMKTSSGLRSAGPISAGQWTDFEVHAKFSSSASSGWVEVRRNGAVVIPRYATANLRPGLRNYLKMGLYRGSSATATSTVYHDGMTVSTP